MTKQEKRAILDKRYREANKEKIKARRKAWRDSNKEHISEFNRLYNESQKDELFTVYYLKEDHYVGQTNHMKARMKKHVSHNGRHVEDVEVLGRFETREEALAFESRLHDMGYHGRNNGQ